MSYGLFLLKNHADTAIVTGSSETDTNPAANVQNSQRTKNWRSQVSADPYLNVKLKSLLALTHAAFVDTNLTKTGTIRLEAWQNALGSVANLMTNSNYVGGVAGTPGTAATSHTADGSVNGLTQTLGFGTDGTQPYMEVTLAGTPSSTFSWQLMLDTTTAEAAVQNDIISYYGRIKLAGGALTNLTSLKLRLDEYSSAPALLVSHTSADLKSNLQSTVKKITYGFTMANASCAKVRPSILLGFTSGQAVNITIRLYAFTVINDGTNTKLVDQTVAPTLYVDPSNVGIPYGLGAYGAGPYGASEDFAINGLRNLTLVALPVGVQSKYWRFTFSDDNVAYGQLGRLYMSIATQFAVGLNYGWQAERIERSSFRESIGGQRYSQPRDSRLKISGSFDFLYDTERTTIMLELQRFGEQKPLIFSITADATNEGLTTTLYGRFSAPQVAGVSYNVNRLSFSAIEEL